jgi:hypothetical protein
MLVQAVTTWGRGSFGYCYCAFFCHSSKHRYIHPPHSRYNGPAIFSNANVVAVHRAVESLIKQKFPLPSSPVKLHNLSPCKSSVVPYWTPIQTRWNGRVRD